MGKVRNLGGGHKDESFQNPPTPHLPNCEKCGKPGFIGIYGRVKYDGTLELNCTCGHKWRSVSGICDECGEVNGFPGNGTCTKCYSLKHHCE